MISPKRYKGYIPTIGVECHVQLRTKTKLFAAVENDARDAAPNTLVSHICLGMPGALPVLNEKALEYASRSGFALHVRPQPYSVFERKHYFYPDLPKGYQITQLSQPIVVGGYVDIVADGVPYKVRINRVQIEEDAGKSTHPSGKDYSLVDLNRAGTPLLEIVSEADMHSAVEAKAYAYELWLLMRYAEVSDADLYHGNMRFDVNVSVSKNPDELGLRTETKNINSFKAVEKSVEYEIKRQVELLEDGKPVVQETRGWDDAKQKTFSQRSKEDAHDYRYFPDPDIPPVVLSEDYISEIEKNMPKMPHEYRDMLESINIDRSTIDVIIADPRSSKLIETINTQCGSDHARRVALWIVNTNNTEESNSESQPFVVTWQNAVKLSQLVVDSRLSSTAAKEIWVEIFQNNTDAEDVAKDRNLLQLSDEGEIEKIVAQVLEDNKQAADDVRGGEMKAIGFLVGQVMKASQGKANPGLAQNLIKKQLGI